MSNKIKIVIFLVVLTSVQIAQTIHVPLGNEIYNYLDRLSVKKIIQLDDESKPFTRRYIAEKLKEVNKRKNNLNKRERDELDWYQQEYQFELDAASGNERWYLYNYTDTLLNIKILPDLGYGISRIENKSGITKWPGLYFWGSYSNWFGASFSYRDKGEFGDIIDKEKNISPYTGSFYKDVSNGIEAADVNGSITFDWQWGSLALIKEYMKWGHGRFGQLVLSDKAPSFPQLRLSVKPVPWIRFSYMHGWLNSKVMDSLYFFYSHMESKEPFLRKKYINKYIAANMLTVSPVNWVDISIGNTFVYSGDLRPEMFIPFLYYKVMDHVTGREGVEDGNGSIFLDIKTNYLKNISFYSTLFLDVIELRDMLKNDWGTSWIGYTVGIKNAGFILENVDLTAEYTKTNAWIYEHKDQSTTYKNYNYSLGHWIGQNADHFRIQVDYLPIRGMRISLFGEHLRKGGLKDIYYAYNEIENQPFLYGFLRKDKKFGLEYVYTIKHGLQLKTGYEYSDITDEDKTRTPEFFLGRKNSGYVLLQVGL